MVETRCSFPRLSAAAKIQKRGLRKANSEQNTQAQSPYSRRTCRLSGENGKTHRLLLVLCGEYLPVLARSYTVY